MCVTLVGIHRTCDGEVRIYLNFLDERIYNVNRLFKDYILCDVWLRGLCKPMCSVVWMHLWMCECMQSGVLCSNHIRSSRHNVHKLVPADDLNCTKGYSSNLRMLTIVHVWVYVLTYTNVSSAAYTIVQGDSSMACCMCHRSWIADETPLGHSYLFY